VRANRHRLSVGLLVELDDDDVPQHLGGAGSYDWHKDVIWLDVNRSWLNLE